MVGKQTCCDPNDHRIIVRLDTNIYYKRKRAQIY